MKVLRIDSSAQRGDSLTRQLGSEVVRCLEQAHSVALISELIR